MNFNICTCLKLCAFPHGSQRFWLRICKPCAQNVSPSLSRCLLCGKLIAWNVEWDENNGCKRLLPHPFTLYYPVFSSVKSSVFTPAFCPLIGRFINFSYFGFSGGAFCSPKLQMTNYQPETVYGVKPSETTKRVPTQTGNLLCYLTGARSPDPINVGENLEMGRSCPKAFSPVPEWWEWSWHYSKGISGRSVRPSVYITIKALHWGGHLQGCSQVKYLHLCESEGCPEQPVKPTFPAAHPSSLFCDDLLQHIKIQTLLFGFTRRWDELSCLVLGL